MNMLKKERLLKIIDIVNSRGFVTVSDIIDELAVSDMTVRRDLDELDKAGKNRTYSRRRTEHILFH